METTHVVAVVYDFESDFPEYKVKTWLSEERKKEEKLKYENVKQYVLSNLEKWRASDVAWLIHAVSNYKKIENEYKKNGLLSKEIREIIPSPDLISYFDERGNTYPYLTNRSNHFGPFGNDRDTRREMLLLTEEGRRAMSEWEQERDKRRAIYNRFYEAKNYKKSVEDWIHTRSEEIEWALKYANMGRLKSMEEDAEERFRFWETKKIKINYFYAFDIFLTRIKNFKKRQHFS